ncbi:MAG: 30S ribosome-binding factor RbfA [Chryseobacterium sp.]|nr:MAG: 30S ribosome-binding factor RbfA [Chryseobacterium sp.]
MESNRQKKVAQVLQEDMAELFRKQSAEAGRNLLITVAGVRVTADLGIAKIYLSIFPTEYRDKVMKEIVENTPSYRNYVGQKLGKQVRVVPELQFYLDTSMDDVERINRELRGQGDNPIL